MMHRLENLRSLRRRNDGQTTGRRVGRGLPRWGEWFPSIFCSVEAARVGGEHGRPCTRVRWAGGSIGVSVLVCLCESAGRVGRPWREGPRAR